jgi:hypothetical protein
MQPLELATLVLFLASYLFTALRAVLAPDAYRASEVRFYKERKKGWDILLPFALGALALPVLIAHFVLETARVAELILYVQVMLSVVVMPMHFMPFMRGRMTRTLSGKSNSDYRRSGLLKMLIAAVMVALPLLV